MARLKSKHLVELADVLSYAFLLGLAYVGCFLAIGDPFKYGGPCFATMLIWAAAHAGGICFGIFRLPPLLGMLLSGMLLKNAIPDAVAPLPPSWSKGFRAVALGTIFLRSGFELDLQVFKKVGPAAVRLLLIPGLVEAFVTGAIAHGVFGMPILVGFTLGFILKAVGPAVVIQTMFDVQTAGYGVEKGIPSIVVGAASFDDMVALTGYSLFSNLSLAKGTGGEFWFKIFHGPLDLALGLIAGLLGSVLCSLTRIWNTPLKRQGVTFITAMVLLFTLYHYKFNAGGALSCIVLGLFTHQFWQKGIHFYGVAGVFSLGPSNTHAHEVEHMVGKFWRFFTQPLLFGIIGTLMDFASLDPSYIPLSLVIIICGIVVRMPTTFFAMKGAGLTWRERLFVACAWTPKATVQAALAAAPADLFRAAGRTDLEDAGQQILTTAVFAILVCAPLGVLLIHFSAPRLLDQAPHKPSHTREESTHPRSTGPSHHGQQLQPLDTTPRPDSPDLRHRMGHMLHDPLVGYIMGTESGLLGPSSATSEDNSGNLSQPTTPMRRNQTSPALLSLDKANTGSPRRGGDIIKAHDNHSGPVLHATAVGDCNAGKASTTTRSEVSDDVRAGRDSNAMVEMAAGSQQVADPTGGAVDQYLRGIERLAEVVDAQAAGDQGLSAQDTAVHAAQLREAVRSLRQKLLEQEAVDGSDEEDLDSARAFFRLAQGASSLPQVGQALELLQVHVSRAG